MVVQVWSLRLNLVAFVGGWGWMVRSGVSETYSHGFVGGSWLVSWVVEWEYGIW